MSAVPPVIAPDQQRVVAYWLLICCALVFAMVVLGGVTRLTGSGLSMVTWEPIVGVLPPLTEAQWQASFERYQQTPEYQKKNLGMGLAQYKGIFWFEYAHRLLGRGIAVAVLLPLLFLIYRQRIDRSLVPKMVVVVLLVGLQGALGWYMVASGLVDNPRVSQYRLTAHLAAAFLIYAYMLWVALGLLFPAREAGPALQPLQRFTHRVAALIGFTVLSGGFVAGTKAGFTYNTFPLMDGHWVPPTYWLADLGWRNFFENIATVQFDHRVLAVSSLLAVGLLWLSARRYPLPARAQLGFNLMFAMAIVQVTLGISTLLLLVPIPLASAHQAGALLLFSFTLFTLHALRRR